MMQRKKVLLSLGGSILLLLLVVGIVIGPDMLQVRPIATALAASDMPLAPNDVNWYIGDGQGGYNNMINGIRANFSPYYNTSRITATTSTPSSSNPRFWINVYTGTAAAPGTSFVRLLMRTDNLYIEGWLNPVTDAFYRLRDQTDAIPSVPQLRGTSIYPLPYAATYGSLEGTAKQTRQGMKVNMGVLKADVTSMLNYAQGTSAATVQASALAILRMAQVVAEAARFFYIATQVANGLATQATTATLDVADTSIETDWSLMSKNVVAANQNAAPVATYTIPAAPSDNNAIVTLATIARYAAIIAIFMRPKK